MRPVGYEKLYISVANISLLQSSTKLKMCNKYLCFIDTRIVTVYTARQAKTEKIKKQKFCFYIFENNQNLKNIYNNKNRKQDTRQSIF